MVSLTWLCRAGCVLAGPHLLIWIVGDFTVYWAGVWFRRRRSPRRRQVPQFFKRSHMHNNNNYSLYIAPLT